MATVLASGDLSKIEVPRRPTIQERRSWAAVLADNQWSYREMKLGVAWAALQKSDPKHSIGWVP